MTHSILRRAHCAAPLALFALAAPAFGVVPASPQPTPQSALQRARPAHARPAAARPTPPPPGAQVVDLRTVGLNQPIGLRTDVGGVALSSVADSPFQEEETLLMRRSEAGVFLCSADGTSPGGSSYLIDDTAAGEGVVPGTLSTNSGGRNVRDAVAADVDRDGKDEILALVLEGPFLQVWQIDVADAGAPYAWTLVHEFAPFATSQFVTARLVVGDLDGDRRDEISVLRTVGDPNHFDNDSTVWVLDDPVDGAGVLLQLDLPGNSTGMHARYFGVTADLDADGDDEFVLARQGDTSTKGRVRLSMYDWDEASGTLVMRSGPRVVYTDPAPVGGNYMVSKLAAGQLDSDPEEELVLMSSTPKLFLNLPLGTVYFIVDQLNYDGATRRFDHVERATYSGACEATPIPEYCFDVAVADRFGDGRDWIAHLRKPNGGTAEIFCLREDAANGGWDSVRVMDGVPTVDDAVSLAAADADGDGVEELFAGFSWGSGTTKFDWITRVEAGASPSQRTLSTPGLITSTAASPTQPIALAVGEFDGDGLRVRYEGTQIRASNPVPLTLLAAAPTKAGIGQNYSGTSTGYSVATGSGFETELSLSTSLSAKAGFEIEDFTGTFGASVKATVEVESRTSNAVSSTTTFVTGYEGGAEADVIVFASNQFLVHTYLILDADDPNAVGERFSIDVPIDTRISKWTVPFFNAAVAPRYRIGTDLLPHTVGDPSTYRNYGAMAADIGGLVGWETPGALTVGQGTGGNVSMAIELATENATTQQTEVSVGTEASYKAYGASVETSVSAGVGSAYTVSTNRTTTFSGQLGDISGPDYVDWAYAAGMVVYQAWRTADGNNEPTGWLPGGYPLTVVDFWVDPFGAAY
ncbi:MAG: hypothetical protein AAFU73_02095 [Planctomycetota bacterium]